MGTVLADQITGLPRVGPRSADTHRPVSQTRHTYTQAHRQTASLGAVTDDRRRERNAPSSSAPLFIARHPIPIAARSCRACFFFLLQTLIGSECSLGSLTTSATYGFAITLYKQERQAAQVYSECLGHVQR